MCGHPSASLYSSEDVTLLYVSQQHGSGYDISAIYNNVVRINIVVVAADCSADERDVIVFNGMTAVCLHVDAWIKRESNVLNTLAH